VFDPQMKLANQLQRLILRQNPKAISSLAIKALCEEIVSQNQMVGRTGEIVNSLDILFSPVSGHA